MTPEKAAVPLSSLLPEAEPLPVLSALSDVMGAAAVVVAVLVSVVSGRNTVVDEGVVDVSFISGIVVVVTVVVLEDSVALVKPASLSGFVVDSCVALLSGAKVVVCKSV